MADDNKLFIDISISGNSKQQVDKYIKSFDSLRNSIIGLSQPLNSIYSSLNTFEKSLARLNDTTTKFTDQSKEIASSGNIAGEKISGLAGIFSNLLAIFELTKIAIKGWTIALTGGLAIITTFLPEIINFAKALFTGKGAVSTMAANFKDLNEVMKASNKDAASEVTRLQLLYKSAMDVNNTSQDRLKSISELRRLYPDHLKGLKDENILNGTSKISYDQLSKSIFETARAKAALNKMTDEATKILDADFQIQKIKNANFNEKQRYQREAAAAGNGSRGAGGRYALEYYKKNSDERARIAIEEQEQIKKAATNSVDYLTKYAGGVNKIAKSITGNGANPTAETDNKVSTKNTQTNNVNVKIGGHPTHKPKPSKDDTAEKDQEALLASQGRMAMSTLQGYAKEVEQTNQHFAKLKDQHKANKGTVEQLERERMAALKKITEQFNKEEIGKLDAYNKQLNQIAIDSIKDATERSLAELKQDTKAKTDEMDRQSFSIVNKINNLTSQANILKKQGKDEELKIVERAIQTETQMLEASGKIKLDFIKKQNDKEAAIKQAKIDTDEKENENKLSASIQNNEQSGHVIKALREQQQLLDLQYNAAISAAKRQGKDTADIEEGYARKKADLEQKLMISKIHAGDRYIDAVLKNTKKDSAIFKAAFMAKKAIAIADVIMSTKKAIISSFEGYAKLPFIGQALAIAQGAFIAGQGAMSIAEIAKQKPGFAQGGRYVSDGRGAMLPGYSRTDNTNAYLRSGEAVVVSEAMRNPWARNLVSAINVAHGGRDFSAPNTGRGYAVGGIFTDGGNSNRYYNQPVNDIKDMANTLAYQMINNFPPIYVDVKDVNNQQNILAQTVNRVNL